MNAPTIIDVELQAAMTDDELRLWEALPPTEQLARLRAAIDKGVASGPTDLTMDAIWSRLQARHPDAKL